MRAMLLLEEGNPLGGGGEQVLDVRSVPLGRHVAAYLQSVEVGRGSDVSEVSDEECGDLEGEYRHSRGN